MKMLNERAQKIRELKANIELMKSAVSGMFMEATAEREGETEEEKKERTGLFKTQLAVKKAEISGAVEELKLIRLNKHGSQHFQWLPHKGMNRKQARAFRRSRTRV